MTQKIIFSIIIPAYNYGHLIERAIQSAVNQGGSDYEVLVINDGSSDNTEQILLNLQKKHPEKFNFITNNNLGLAATRNCGINNTTGKYLMFLDADDKLLPNALNYFRIALAKNKSEPGIITGAHISVFPCGKEKLLPARIKSQRPEKKIQDYLIKNKSRLCNGSLIMHRKIFDCYRYPEHFRNSEDISVFAYALANFSCIELTYPINKVYKSITSLRNNYKYAIDVADHLVDEVFNPERLPPPCQKYKKLYTASRCLHLARIFHNHKDYGRSMRYLRKSVAHNWKILFKTKTIKIILYCFFRNHITFKFN